MKTGYIVVCLIGLLSFSLLFAGGVSEGEKHVEGERIRIGIMPDAGALPLLLMDDLVESIPFMSARERETAFITGEIDGYMGDLVSIVNNSVNGSGVKVLTLTESRFMIVAHPDFDTDDVWEVGISEHTVIDYMVDRLLSNQATVKVAIPQVPVRLEMLRSAKIPLACLTDAMAWPLLAQGFPIVRDQADTDLTPAVLAFSSAWADENPEVIEAFKTAWNEAVDEINQEPDAFRTLLLEQVRLPEASAGLEPFPVPQYHHITLPSEKQVKDVISWYGQAFDTVVTDLSYEAVVIR